MFSRYLNKASQALLTLDRRTAEFLGGLLASHRRSLSLAFSGSLLAAAFEGTTMGIFALALHTLVGDEARLGAGYGWLGSLVDGWQSSLGRDRVFVLLIALAVLTQLLRAGMRFGSDCAAAYLQSGIEGEVRRRIFRQYMSLTYGQVRSYMVGDLAAYMQQVSYLGGVLYRSNIILGQLLLLAAYLAVLLWLSGPGTVLAVVAMVLASLGLRSVVRRVRSTADEYRSHVVRLSERTLDFLNAARLLRSFAREAYATQKIDSVIGKVAAARRIRRTEGHAHGVGVRRSRERGCGGSWDCECKSFQEPEPQSGS